MVDAGERSLAVATEQIKRSPTEHCGALGPTAVEKPTAVVNELHPAPRGNVAGRLRRIEPGERIRPSTGCASLKFNNGRTLFLNGAPLARSAIRN
jgi:hypothetical protein